MAAVVCHVDHLAHLNLLRIQRKAVSEARFGVVEPKRQFVEFESAISRVRAATVAQRLHLGRLQRLETLSYFKRLLQRLGLINSGNGGSHRQAHRVSQGFLASEHTFLYRLTMATNGLHPERGDSPAIQLG